MSVGFLTQYYRGLGHSQRIKFIAEKTADYTDVVIMDQLFRPPICLLYTSPSPRD